MMPRFISIRELRDHDPHGHWQGIDTRFGMWSQPVGSDNTVVSAIAFIDVTLRQGKGQVVVDDVEDSEVIRLEVSEDGTCQV